MEKKNVPVPNFDWDKEFTRLHVDYHSSSGSNSVAEENQYIIMNAMNPRIDDREDVLNMVKGLSVTLQHAIKRLEQHLDWEKQLEQSKEENDTEPGLMVYVYSKDEQDVMEIIANSFEETLLEFIAYCSDGDESETAEWVNIFKTQKFSFGTKDDRLSYIEFFNVMAKYEQDGIIPG